MLEATTRVIERVCGDKARIETPKEARQAARRLTAQGRDVAWYRCPFHGPGEPSHYHTGHVPSLDSMQAIANAIRDRAGNAPGQKANAA